MLISFLRHVWVFRSVLLMHLWHDLTNVLKYFFRGPFTLTETEPPAVEKALNETSMLLSVGGHCTPDLFFSLSAAVRVNVALLVLCEMRQCSCCYHVQLRVTSFVSSLWNEAVFPSLSSTTEGECGFVLCEMRQRSLSCHVLLTVNVALLVIHEMRQCSLCCHVQQGECGFVSWQ